MNPIVFLISWFASGLIGTIIMLIHDFRGTEYDENAFDKDLAWTCFIMTLFGYVVIILIIVYMLDEKMYLKRFGFYVHKLANIGVKKEKNKNG